MTKLQKILGVLALLVIVALGITVWGSGHGGYGNVQNEKWYFNGPVDFSGGVNSLVSGAESAIVNAAGAWTGAISTANSVTITGAARVSQFIDTGAKVIATGATSTSVTGAQICAGSYFEWGPAFANATATLPSAAALTCLTTTGDQISVPLIWKNTSATGSTTVFLAGASTTLVYENATTTTGSAMNTLAGGSLATLRFLMASSSDPTSGVTVLINQFK